MKCSALLIVCLLAAIGCQQTSVRGPSGKEMVISAPNSVVVQRGLSQTVNFGIERKGFTDPVMATISDLPRGVTASKTRQTVDGGNVEFQLTAAPGADLVANHRAKITVSSTPDGIEASHFFPVSVKD